MDCRWERMSTDGNEDEVCVRQEMKTAERHEEGDMRKQKARRTDERKGLFATHLTDTRKWK